MPKTFDREAAKKAGYTDEQINAYLGSEQAGVDAGYVPQVDQALSALENEKKGFRLTDLLPTAGGILGGIGGSFIAPGAGTIVGGGAGSAAGEALRQLLEGEQDYGKIAMEGGLGLAGGAAGEVIGKGTGLALRALGKTGEMATTQATKSVLNASKSGFAKAIEEHGIDLGQVFRKHFGNVSNYDELVGGVTERGTGGLLGQKLAAAEKLIQTEVKNAGSTIRFSADDFVKALKNERNILSKTIGNTDKIDDLDRLIVDTQKRFSNGVSAKQLLDLKRAADSKFGKAVLDTDKGSVIASAQKVLGNTARSLLKSRFKNIAQALDEETELLTLQPILNSARAAGMTGKGALSFADLAALGIPTLVNPAIGVTALATKKAIENPRVMSAIGNTLTSGTEKLAQSGGTATIKALNQALGQGGVRGVAPLFINSNIESGKEKEYQNDKLHMTDSIPQPQEEVNTATGYTIQELAQGYTSALQAGDKNAASALKALYDFEVKHQENMGGKMKEKTQKQQLFQTAADGAKHALSLLESGKVNVGPVAGRIESFKSGTVGTSKGQQDYMSTIALARSALLNAYLGGNIPPSEYERISDAIPSENDPAPTAKQKLMTFIREVERFSNTNVADQYPTEEQIALQAAGYSY